jgi:hypothetical protein
MLYELNVTNPNKNTLYLNFKCSAEKQQIKQQNNKLANKSNEKLTANEEQ